MQFIELAKLAEGYPPEKTQLVSLKFLALSPILPLLRMPISAVFPEKMQESTVIPKLPGSELKTPVVIVLS
jgi:hypothetical protein